MTETAKPAQPDAVTKALTVPGLEPVANALKRIQGSLAAALPAHIKAERMIRIVLGSIRKTPRLAECELRSLLGAVMVSAQLGLEPDGTLGEAYLVPYGKECQLIPGYKGLMKLARQSGQVSSIAARAVHERDHFLFEFGLNEKLEHRPYAGGDSPGELTWVYAIARLRDGGVHLDVMSRADVEKIRDKSQGYQAAKKYNKQTPWDDHFDEMAKKTVVRRLCKMLPSSVELSRAVAMDEAADRGVGQGLTEALAMDGIDVPLIEGEAAPEGKRMALGGRRKQMTIEMEATSGQGSGDGDEKKSDAPPSEAPPSQP